MREVPGVEGTRFAAITMVVETGSTNRDLLAAAAAGAPEGRVLITDHQTSGRGRQGRTWVDEPGSSLLCSVLLRPPSSWAPFVPLATGLAIVDAVRTWGIDLGLKWPNDVLADVAVDAGDSVERKVCGILAEAITSGDGMAVVVGFGFNLAWKDVDRLGPDVAARGIDLRGLFSLEGRPEQTPDRLELARGILAALEEQIVLLDDQGTSALLERYRPRCRTLGRAVRFETSTGVIEGQAVDVAADGGLVIDTGGADRVAVGRVTVHAGDAHHV